MYNSALWEKVKGGGHRYSDSEHGVIAFVMPTKVYEKVKGPVVSWMDRTNDEEIFADGLISHEEAAQMRADYEASVARGWDWTSKEVTKWRVLVIHHGSEKSFTADFEAEGIALGKTNEALPKIYQRKRPNWLTEL